MYHSGMRKIHKGTVFSDGQRALYVRAVDGNEITLRRCDDLIIVPTSAEAIIDNVKRGKWSVLRDPVNEVLNPDTATWLNG